MTKDNDEGFEIQWKEKCYLVPIKCPHKGASLRLGTFDSEKGIIACPLHYATFELPSGRRLTGPLCGNLVIKQIT
jgi:nitrite reductase/ring-hydroxylating ferredoxin subunit